jgi:hypothetical protein
MDSLSCAGKDTADCSLWRDGRDVARKQNLRRCFDVGVVMPAKSKLTADIADGKTIVGDTRRYSSEDIHQLIFVTPPARRSLEELKDGIAQ